MLKKSKNVPALWIAVLLLTTSPALAELSCKDPEQPQGPSRKPFTFKDFPKDLGCNFLGLFSSDNLMPLIIGSAATGVGAAFDGDSQDFFANGSRLGPGDGIFGERLGAGWTISASIAGLMAIGHFRNDQRMQAMSYSMAQGFVMTGLLTMGTKRAVGRWRPDGSDNRSFPSGHASQSFAFAAILSHYYPKARIPAYLTAGFVAASRVDHDVHFASDVIAGAALGYIVGRTVVRRSSKNSPVSWIPYASPSRREVGFLFRAQFK